MTSYNDAIIDEITIRNEVDVIRELANGLHQFLVGKSDADLGRQSACDAWTVRDVAGHLTNRAERQIASMTRGRAGDSGAPDGFSRPIRQHGNVGGQRRCRRCLHAVNGRYPAPHF